MECGVAVQLGIIGFGKIAMDQHLPAIGGNADFELIAAAGPGAENAPVTGFATHTAMLAELGGRMQAVAICTPPSVRYAIARDCIAAGLHVLLEKPPTVTLGHAEMLKRLAAERGVSLFASWHARHNRAVMAAASLAAGRRLDALQIEWCEDVRQWHPGQTWIWRPGGFGVFDAAINAFSIATLISPAPLLVGHAEFVVPQNLEAPIAACLTFDGLARTSRAVLDWRGQRLASSLVRFQTQDGLLDLRDGGATLCVDRKVVVEDTDREYPQIYEHFAHLIRSRASEVDTEPLRLVADAFMTAQHVAGDPFIP